MGEINNPNQIVLVTTRHKDEDNIITLTWWTKTSFQPNLYLISVAKTRFSCGLIKKSKCFCINFMPYEFKDKVLFCGTNSGKNTDKFKEIGFTKIEAETINCPIIKQALAYLECKVIKSVETGDHVIFIGEVKKAKLNKQGKRSFQLDGDKFTTTVD